MEITTNSSTYLAASSTNKINNESNIDNTTLSIFEKLIDNSKAIDTKTSDYYVNSNTPSTSSVTYEKPTSVKWEDQLVYPRLYDPTFDPGAYESYKNSESYDPIGHEWATQTMKATNGNKYEDAPEFEAFVKKWMDKGKTEEQALSRAQTYAQAGLLDYGKQKIISMCNLPYGDIKQHGFHLINNEPLKNAVMKTLDSLNYEDAADLVSSIFEGFPENKGVSSSFQELLDNFGVKLEDLKNLNPEEHKDDKFTFTGDINLKNGADSKEYNNFILDTLVKFFKDRIERFNYCVENTPAGMTNNLDALKDSTNSLIDNLKKEVDVYNNGFLKNQETDNKGN